MQRPILRTGFAGLAFVLCGTMPLAAAEITWEVENPFRLYKDASAFALHERAFEAVRGNGNEVPADIIWRIERRLNDPDCSDPTTAATCAATVRNARQFNATRLGWAARTVGATCYDSNSRPRHYPANCTRNYSFKKSVRESYILPQAHMVHVKLSPTDVAQYADRSCKWAWQPRAGGAEESRTLPCNETLVIEHVPYAKDRAKSGVKVEVSADNNKIAEAKIVVDDLLIVALGDSFASGESNPDRPVTFGSRRISYEPDRDFGRPADGGGYSVQTQPEPDLVPGQAQNQQPDDQALMFGRAKSSLELPRRLMEDEERGQQYDRLSPEFVRAFYQRSATWLSQDCHRSQYGYPFRVALQLALEDRHRAVTLVHLACSGAQVTQGLFEPQDAREGFDKRNSASVPAQFDQLTDLLCAEKARPRAATYRLPWFKYGSAPSMREITKHWCAPSARKRDVDLMLLSIGGNDVGFSALAAYAMTERASDLAPIVGWIGQEIRFGPEVASKYLEVLDERMRAVKEALQAGFGVGPERVVQTSYEPVQYDENGAVCGAQPERGMDVHPGLKLGIDRMRRLDAFYGAFLKRLVCIADASTGGCGQLATGKGTGFTLVTTHQEAFRRRGICARDPAHAAADGAAMAMPRFNAQSSTYRPYHPAYFTPYAGRQRLFHTPNDAFLTANTHHEKTLLYDPLQPVYAALYSGAFHPTAEGHAIVADHVMPQARRVVGKSNEGVSAIAR